MTASTLELLSSQLLSTSLSAAVIATGVWLACRWVPALPASTRATLWWLVTLKLLVGLIWVSPVSLPILPADSSVRSALTTPPSAPAFAVGLGAPAPYDGAAIATPSASVNSPIGWRSGLVVIWLGGLVMIAARFLWQLRRSLRIVARAVPADARLAAVTHDAATRLGLSSVPEVCTSDDIDAPLLVGLHRPRIVVPRDRFAALSPSDQRIALCHELVHHRRGDLWHGLVPALAERVFFFHPLARLATREYLVAREAACDAEVVETLDVSPYAYGRLLLALGVGPMQARFAAGGSSRSVSALKRRLVMLSVTSPTRKARIAGWAIAAAAACALVPVRLVGRAVVVPVPATQAVVIEGTAPAIAAAEVAPRGTAQASEKPVVTDDRDRIEYALVLGGSTTMSGAISSQRLDALRGSSARLLWFRTDGREYVVRDEAAIARAVEITRPMREIGAAQGEVGSRQGAIGAEQGEVGAKQGNIGAQQGAIGARQGEVAARQAALAAREAGASEAQREQLDHQRAELDQEMRKLDDQMRALDEQMREADRPMADLDAKMRVLDDEMRALDAKMHEAEPKVRAELRAFFEQLVAKKLAEPVR